MKAHVVIALTVAFISVSPAGAWDVPPPGRHPRLVFNQTDLGAIRRKLDDPRGRLLFEQVRSSAQHNCLRPASSFVKQVGRMETFLKQARARGESGRVEKKGGLENMNYMRLLVHYENAALVYAVTGEKPYGLAAKRALLVTLQTTPEVYGPARLTELLRPGALIYDWCHDLFTESERQQVRQDIQTRSTALLADLRTRPYALAPSAVHQCIYWGMYMGAYLGIGALAVEGEPGTDPTFAAEARRCVLKSMDRFIDEHGYHENGPSYTGFGFCHACYYLEALRRRGVDWSRHPRLSKLPGWIIHLTLPGSLDVAPYTLPVGNSNFGLTTAQDAFVWLRHALPDDRAMNYVYRHVMAPGNNCTYYRSLGPQFLWDRPMGPMPDLDRMPRTKWFADGGVFFRSDWRPQAFCFWLKTQQHRCSTGKHDDYGSFYLHAYGEPFCVEAGGKHWRAEDHNLVWIDNRSIDRAGYVMPSAPLVGLVDGAFASGATVDQQEAYSSDFKLTGPRNDLERRALNPVRRARRTAVVVWAGHDVPPYALVVDDIDADGKPHTYRWQMLTNPNHKVAIDGRTAHLSRDRAPAEPFVPPVADGVFLSPDKVALAVGQTRQKRPCLQATVKAVNPRFAVLFYPRRTAQPCITIGMPDPDVASRPVAGGRAARLGWWSVTDTVVMSDGKTTGADGVTTDAAVAVVRRSGNGAVLGAIAVDATRLTVKGLNVTCPERSTWAWDAASGRLAVGQRGLNGARPDRPLPRVTR